MSEWAQPGHLEHKSRVWDEGHGPHSPGLSHLFPAIGVHHALPEGTNTEAHSTALLDEGHLPNSSATALPKINALKLDMRQHLLLNARVIGIWVQQIWNLIINHLNTYIT